MTWQSVGTHTFMPTDMAVEVGSFDLTAGQDTIWVRITQLNDPADWPFSYGILSWRNANGSPLGSIKAYSNRFGEVFRLGNGLPPSDGTGSIWFEPRGFNLAWLKAGFPWQLQFEAQAGASDMTSGYWNRDPVNGVLSPRTSGDSVDTNSAPLTCGELVCDGMDGPFARVNTLISNNLYVKDTDGNIDANRRLQAVTGGSASNNVWIGNQLIQTYTPSDIRTKENVRTTSVDASKLIKSIEVVDFNFIGTGLYETKDTTTKVGFIAQDIQAIFPQAVTTPEEPDGLLLVRRDELIPILTKALQDALNRIELLEAKLGI